MTLRARNRTPAYLAAQQPQPLLIPTQDEIRDRRRKVLPVYRWPDDWSLNTEFAAICEQLAERVAAAPNPAAHLRAVAELADAVHAAVHVVVGLLAQADAERRTQHLGTDDRGRSIRALIDLAERPAAPEITDDTLTEGTWSAALTALAAPYTEELARLLGSAMTPAIGDRLLAALSEVDAAALTLGRKLDRDQVIRANRASQRTPSQAERMRAELESLGVAT